MKKQILLLVCVSFFAFSLPMSHAQTNKELRQEAKAAAKKDKALTSKIKDNATRDAKKETKALEKAGFTAAVGAIPLSKQIDQAWKYQYDVDKDGYPVYYVSTQTAIGGNYSAAKMQATALAKSDLAGQVATQVGEVIKLENSNELVGGSAVSISSIVSSSKQKILQNLGRTLPVVEISRTLPNNTVEVRVTVAYDYAKGNDDALRLVREQLSSSGAELSDEVDSML
ncbi:MAG: hypothetical protein R3Y19_01020 [Rikenellaceae bacterium]